MTDTLRDSIKQVLQDNVELADYNRLTEAICRKVDEYVKAKESRRVAKFEATVRKINTNLPGDYGLIRSKQLAPFIGKEMIVSLEEIDRGDEAIS